MKDNIFKDKTLLITGGTGSFGKAVLRRFLETGIKEIRIFSRDELKQDNKRRFYTNDNKQGHIETQTLLMILKRDFISED